MDAFEQQVRVRAYHIWEDDGRVFGRAEEHWLKAEAEMRQADVVLLVRQAAADPTLAASPAKTLKPRAPRAASPAAKVVAAKSVTAKSVAAKSVAAKAESAKAESAKASKPATAKKAPSAKTASGKTAAPRPRTASSREAVATVH